MGHFPIRKMADARHICDTHTQHILYCLDDGDEKVVPEYQVRCYVINHDFTEYFLIPNRIIPRDQSEYEMAYDELRIADDDVIIVQRAKRVIHFNLMRYMNNTEHHHQKTYWDYQWEWRNQYTTCHNRVCYMLAENVIQSAGGKRENRNGLMVFNLDVFPYIQKRMLHPAAADMIPSLDREIQMPLRLVPVYHRHNVRDDLMPLGQIQGTVYIRGTDTYFMGMKMKEEKIYSFNCSFVSSASLKVTNDTRSRLLTNCFEYKKEHKGVNDTFDYLQYSTDETLVIDQYNLNYRKFISYPKRRKGWLARPEMRLDAVRADVKRAKEDRDNPDKTRCYFQRPNCTVTCDDYENSNRLFKVCKHVEPDWTQPMEILGESSIYDFPHRKLPYDRAFNRHYMGMVEQKTEMTYCSATTKTQLKYRYQSCIGTIYEWRHPRESKREAKTQGQTELTYDKQRKDGAYTIFQLGKVCKHKKLNAYPLVCHSPMPKNFKNWTSEPRYDEVHKKRMGDGQNHTMMGKPCIEWDPFWYDKHWDREFWDVDAHPKMNFSWAMRLKDMGIFYKKSHNYCSNFDNDIGTWCFIEGGGWDYCCDRTDLEVDHIDTPIWKLYGLRGTYENLTELRPEPYL